MYVPFQKYQEIIDSLPDLEWVKDVLPNDEQLKIIQKSLYSIFNNVKDIDIGKIIKLIVFTMEELKCVIRV